MFEHGHRQVGRAVETAGAVDDRFGPLLGVVEEVLERLVGLLFVDHQQDRVGGEAGERNEIGTRGFRLPSEQLVDFGVTGDAVVVRQDRITIRLGVGGDLRADLTAGAGLGFDHDRLLEDRFELRRDRPGYGVVCAAGRKRDQDGNGMRGKSILRESRPGREGSGGSGGADDETAAIHLILPESCYRLYPAIIVKSENRALAGWRRARHPKRMKRLLRQPCTRPMSRTAASMRAASASQNLANSG